MRLIRDIYLAIQTYLPLSLALKLMAIYTLKANILVHFYHLNYLLVLSRFKSLYFHFCETALNSYGFIHQISPFNSLYIFSPFRIKLLFGTQSKLLFKTRLIRDIYLAIQTCFGHRATPTYIVLRRENVKKPLRGICLVKTFAGMLQVYTGYLLGMRLSFNFVNV